MSPEIKKYGLVLLIFFNAIMAKADTDLSSFSQCMASVGESIGRLGFICIKATAISPGETQTVQSFTLNFPGQTIEGLSVVCTYAGISRIVSGGSCGYSIAVPTDNLSNQTPGNVNTPAAAVGNQMCAQKAPGSIINISQQSVGEEIAITGTPFQLYYFSQNDPGNTAKYLLKDSFTVSPNTSTNSIQYSVTVTQDGQVTNTVTYPMALTILNLNQTWNGTDLGGSINPFIDSAIFSIQLTTSTTSSNGVTVPTYSAIPDYTLPPDNFQIAVYKPQVWGLGAWSLSDQHFYDPKTQQIFFGDGSTRAVSLSLTTVAPYGSVYVAPSTDDSVYYIFDTLGRHLETRTSLLGATVYKFNYDAQNHLLRVVDGNGLTTQFVRNSSGNLTQIVAPFGQLTKVTTNSVGRLASVTDPSGAFYSVTYTNNSGLVSGITYPDGHSTNFSFDGSGNFSGELKSDGSSQSLSSTISNASANYVNSITLSTGLNVSTNYQFSATASSSFSIDTYNGQGLADQVTATATSLSETNANLTTTMNFTNDSRWGSLLQYPANVVNQTNDAATEVVLTQTINSTKNVITNPTNPLLVLSQVEQTTINNATYTQSFSASTKQMTIISPLGRQIGITLDSQERATQIAYPNSLPTAITYNGNGLTTQINNAGNIYKYGYDQFGQLQSVLDPLNNKTQFVRDADGRVTQKISPNGDSVNFQYTTAGAISKITTPSGQVHVFQRGFMDLLISYIPPILQIFGSTNTVYNYDSDHRLTQIQKPSGSQVSYTYSAGANFISNISMSGSNTQYGFQTDANGRITYAGSNEGYSTSINYTGYNTDVQYFTGSRLYLGQVSLSRDNNFRIISATIIDSSQNNSVVIPFAYDSDGRITQAGQENYAYSEAVNIAGQAASASITDSMNGFSTVTGSSMSSGAAQTSSALSFNSNTNSLKNSFVIQSASKSGLTTSSSDVFSVMRSGVVTNLQSVTRNYQDDVNNRLTGINEQVIQTANGVTTNSGQLNSQYTFNAGSNGNIALYNHLGLVTTATYDSQDRLTSLKGAITRNFVYDADGNLQSISNCLGTKAFVYDEFSNLKQVTLPSGKVINYYIDPFNRRVARFVNGQPNQYYLWYDQTHLAAILDQNGLLDTYYVYGPKGIAPDYMVKQGVTYKIQSDNLGFIRNIFAMDGALAQQIAYDEFGMVISDSNPGFQVLYQAGGIWDTDTELVRFGARDYDPSVGRWTTKDPIGFSGGDTNLYGYAAENPVNNIDPSGLAVCTYSISSHTLSCSGASNGFGSSNFVSGQGGIGQNNPNYTGFDFSEMGPIPPGVYLVGPPTPGSANSGNPLGKRPLTPFPVPNTDRTDFRAHGCGNPTTCSHGCIGATTNPTRDNFSSFLNSQPAGDVNIVIVTP